MTHCQEVSWLRITPAPLESTPGPRPRRATMLYEGASRALPSWNGGAHGCRQRTRLWRRLAGARAERTINMLTMVVTLDVFKLSGWLNADAPCRVERESINRAATGGPGRGRAWARRRRKQRAGRGPNCGGCWQGHARSAPETCCSCSRRWMYPSSAAG